MSRSPMGTLPSRMSLGWTNFDVVDEIEFLQQDGADQSVEIAAGDEAEFGIGHDGLRILRLSCH